MSADTDARMAERRRLTSRAAKRHAQHEQDLLAGLWRFPVLHKTDFDPGAKGTWLYHDQNVGHAEETSVVLLLGGRATVFRCVGDGESGLLRWLSVEACEEHPS